MINQSPNKWRGSRGHDHMLVGFTTTNVPGQAVPVTIKVVSSNLVHGDMYSMQHYVIKFVSDLRQGGDMLWVLWFPPPIKLTARI